MGAATDCIPRGCPSSLLPVFEVLQDKQVGQTQDPFKLLPLSQRVWNFYFLKPSGSPIFKPCCCYCCCEVASVMSNFVWPQRRQPTRLPHPWILQARTLEWVAISFSSARKWKWSRSVVSDSSRPIDCSLPGSSVHGIFQARVLEWGAIAFSNSSPGGLKARCSGGSSFWCRTQRLWSPVWVQTPQFLGRMSTIVISSWLCIAYPGIWPLTVSCLCPSHLSRDSFFIPSVVENIFCYYSGNSHRWLLCK